VSIDWMLVISELEMMQKDSVVAQLRWYLGTSLKGAEETNKKLQDSIMVKTQTRQFPNTS
jgi:hypothetical protein